MAGPRVIGMPVGDDGAIHRAGWVDIGARGNAIEALGPDLEPVLGVGRCVAGVHRDKVSSFARFANRSGLGCLPAETGCVSHGRQPRVGCHGSIADLLYPAQFQTQNIVGRPKMAAEHDVDLVVRDAFFAGTADGVLVEVGAARPEYLSISASYRALGRRIIAIEPNPEFCAAHRALGHDILEYAATDTEADDASFSSSIPRAPIIWVAASRSRAFPASALKGSSRSCMRP